MSTDRPDLPTFDGRDVREHADTAAEAVRAINHTTGWPGGMTYPADAYTVLERLAALAAMLPQAVWHIDLQLAKWHDAGHIGIDRGTPLAGNPGEAVTVTAFALIKSSDRAEELYAALHEAAEAIAHAHWTGPDPDSHVGIVDDRAERAGDDGQVPV